MKGHSQCDEAERICGGASTGISIRHTGTRWLTIDVDGSVVSTGQRVQCGFNPHHRKVPSFCPITAYEARSRQVLRVQNRPGNVHDLDRLLEAA